MRLPGLALYAGCRVCIEAVEITRHVPVVKRAMLQGK